jgi:predicted enzyme involved in methoxymalonyl-ACP biosynthesis
MISVIIARAVGSALDIDTWLMSCRVLGRGVEQVALNLLVAHARARGLTHLTGRYIPTAKNGLVRDHYEKLRFTKVDDNSLGTTTWHCDVAAYVDADVPIKVADRQDSAAA